MTTVKVYNRDGNLSGEMELPKKIEAAWNPELVYQVIKALSANRRKTLAHTKGRSEVRGGGIKPWRQKGTGRARHGSIRSPLWKGGGVTGGPNKERNFSEKINKKMLKRAVFCLLSAKAASGNLKVVEYPQMEKPKTKIIAGTIRKVSGDNSILILMPKAEKNLYLSVKNLARTKVLDPANINAFDLANFKEVLMKKETLENYGK